MIKKTSKYKDVNAWIGTNCATRLTVDLPDELHRKFKMIMVSKRMKMSEWILKTVKAYVEKNEKDAGISGL